MPKYPKTDYSLVGMAAPTADQLLAHASRYGLDITGKKTYRNREARYTAYSQFRKDALVEVARVTQSLRAYIAVVEGLGYGHFRKDAEADWKSHHEEEES